VSCQKFYLVPPCSISSLNFFFFLCKDLGKINLPVNHRQTSLSSISLYMHIFKTFPGYLLKYVTGILICLWLPSKRSHWKIYYFWILFSSKYHRETNAITPFFRIQKRELWYRSFHPALCIFRPGVHEEASCLLHPNSLGEEGKHKVFEACRL